MRLRIRRHLIEHCPFCSGVIWPWQRLGYFEDYLGDRLYFHMDCWDRRHPD